MTILTDLGAIDIRDRLPRDNWIVGRRDATTSLTWHYNGPEVKPDFQHGEGLIFQLASDARWQMRPGWGGTKNGAPHLMYHLVVDALGTVFLTAGLDEILWHCAHQDGNGRGLSLHFPLGGNQAPTTAQLASAIRVTDVLRQHHNIRRERVLGHIEWKHATACPGVHLMHALRAYRGSRTPAIQPTPTPAGLRRFRILSNLTLPVRVRQAPRLDAPIAGRLKPDTIVFVDVIKTDGDMVEGDRRWLHMARVPHEQADLGFFSATLARELQ
jgi:hypothetical protein